MPLHIGEVFAGYTVQRALGSGGMGEVYLVQHPRLPRLDALKIRPASLTDDDEFRVRFSRESDLAATLWHPHIVGVHDRGEYNGQLWLSMDFVDGFDASRLLRESHPQGVPVTQVVEIVSAVADALDYAHEQGLLHRDVKPHNILLTEKARGRRRVLLTDFGIARHADDISGLTATNVTIGTVSYTPPEQLMGESLSGAADQYSLAATAFHLLTGAPPFAHSNPAVVISKHLSGPPPRLSDTHPELIALDPAIAKALAKDSADRHHSCTAFAEALAEAATTLDRSSQTATLAAPPVTEQRPPDAAVATNESTVHHRAPPVVVSSWNDPERPNPSVTDVTDSKQSTSRATTSQPPGAATGPTAAAAEWRVGDRAQVIAGDDHRGQIGTVHELWEGDEDGFEICLRFDGDPEPYAYRRTEVAPAAPAPTPTQQRPEQRSTTSRSTSRAAPGPRASQAATPAVISADEPPRLVATSARATEVAAAAPALTGEPDASISARASWRRSAVLVPIVLIVVLFGAGAFAAIQTVQTRHAAASPPEWQPFIEAARTSAVNLTNINYESADQDVQRILDAATGQFHDDFQQRANPFVEVVRQAKSVSTGTVTGAGLEALNGNEAKVLVTVTVKTTKAAQADQESKAWRMRVSIVQTSRGYKASQVEFVP